MRLRDVRCPVCQRGDIWQEAVSNTLYVYSGVTVTDGKEVVDYLLASVAAMLESANAALSGEVSDETA